MSYNVAVDGLDGVKGMSARGKLAGDMNEGLPQDKSLNSALPVVFNLLDKWGCGQADQIKLLGLNSPSTLKKYRKYPESASMSRDLLERMSYLFNIHKSLNILFSNADSVYGWVNKPNQHPFFAGRSAMDIMKQGKVVDLYDVASRLNAFRGGIS